MKVWNTEATAGSAWIVPPLSEHELVGAKYKTRGNALFRHQLHKRVYKLLLNTYLPGMSSRAVPSSAAREHLLVSCFTYLFPLDPPTFVVELGTNVSPLAQLCSAFGAPYIGIEPDDTLRTAMLRDFFG